MRTILLMLILSVVFVGCGNGSQETASVSTNSSAPANTEQKVLNNALEQLNDGNVKGAIDTFTLAIKQNPKNSEAYLMLAETFMRIKNYEEATNVLNAAVNVNPDNGDAYYMLSFNQGMLGNEEDAMQSARKSIDIFQKERNVEKFKRSLVLFNGLTQKAQAEATTQ